MRVIAGRLGGRNFESPKGHLTHPMSDKIRGALFNMLGDISGLTVLDAFAGSGALSFEAVSRGAASTVAIDSNKDAYLAMMRSLDTLELREYVRVVRQNVVSWSRAHEAEKFALVLADPPYDDIRPAILEQLTVHVANGGLFVLSWPGGRAVPVYEDLALVSNKSYGDAQLCVYRR